MRYGGAQSSGKASTICWAVQWAVGCSVTLKWTTRRRWGASTTRTKRTRRRAVGTVKKSRETRSQTWLARNIRQAPLRYEPRDGALGDVEPQPDKFPVNSRGAPQRIGRSHPSD